ncbi:hypothetical protein IG616_05725 [Labrenzia suaedae]|uniref:Uncharacterized protein n=2 Tax=Roseibium litorale TaxID=2803841 RepID=A0ABR9CJK8_9HYPH|nr:hypothetical protein [Roseibium litorale]
MLLNALTAAALFGAVIPQGVHAADFSDPGWPCQQRKVERLSPGLMWPGLIQTEPSGKLSEDAKTLAEKLALRRISVEEAAPLVDAFRLAHPDADEALMTQIFLTVFQKLSGDRSRIMSGIERYSKKQIALSERIEKARTEMSALMAKPEPDYDAVDKLEVQIDWDERVYTDRTKSLTYVCETPVLLEKRLYALSKLLQEPAAN